MSGDQLCIGLLHEGWDMLPDINGCNKVLENINTHLRTATQDSARLARTLNFVRTHRAGAQAIPPAVAPDARTALQCALAELSAELVELEQAEPAPTALQTSHVRDWQRGQMRDLRRRIQQLQRQRDPRPASQPGRQPGQQPARQPVRQSLQPVRQSMHPDLRLPVRQSDVRDVLDVRAKSVLKSDFEIDFKIDPKRRRLG